jgi:hypothetical protein
VFVDRLFFICPNVVGFDLVKKAAASRKSQTDWARVDALKDDEIDFSDTPEVSQQMFARAIVREGLKPVPRKAH